MLSNDVRIVKRFFLFQEGKRLNGSLLTSVYFLFTILRSNRTSGPRKKALVSRVPFPTLFPLCSCHGGRNLIMDSFGCRLQTACIL